MNAQILQEALSLVNAERLDDYGTPADSFGRIAAMWSAYLDRPLSCRDVACLMALLKLGREAHRHKRDNLLDAAGYIGLADDMARQKESQSSE